MGEGHRTRGAGVEGGQGEQRGRGGEERDNFFFYHGEQREREREGQTDIQRAGGARKQQVFIMPNKERKRERTQGFIRAKREGRGAEACHKSPAFSITSPCTL